MELANMYDRLKTNKLSLSFDWLIDFIYYIVEGYQKS